MESVLLLVGVVLGVAMGIGIAALIGEEYYLVTVTPRSGLSYQLASLDNKHWYRVQADKKTATVTVLSSEALTTDAIFGILQGTTLARVDRRKLQNSLRLLTEESS